MDDRRFFSFGSPHPLQMTVTMADDNIKEINFLIVFLAVFFFSPYLNVEFNFLIIIIIMQFVQTFLEGRLLNKNFMK